MTYDQHQNMNNSDNSNDIELQFPELRDINPSTSSSNLMSSKSGLCKKANNHNIVCMRLASAQQMKKVRFFEQKLSVYNFLQRSPRGIISIVYQTIVALIVITCLVLTVFSTIPDSANEALDYLKIMDSFALAFFSAEFIARFWSSECLPTYRGLRGKFRFLRSPLRIIDLLVICSTAVVVFSPHKSLLFSTSLRCIRFLQAFQVLKINQKFNPWKVMGLVLWAQREHLVITIYLGFLALLSISFLINLIERDENPSFDNLGSSLWWGVITLCTIGYGDMYPITPMGKLLTCICSIIGVSIFALPAGILGTGLALKVQEQQRLRKMSKRRIPAAQLIQSVWRYYLADKKSIYRISLRKSFKSGDQIHRSTIAANNAIKFILIVKYFVSRRKLSAALKPYDIKDIVEQYAAGHTEILVRVKRMDTRMNAIQAIINSNLKTLQELRINESFQMSKVEKLLNESLIKLNYLIKNERNHQFMINSD